VDLKLQVLGVSSYFVFLFGTKMWHTYTYKYIQGVPRGNVNILGGHSIGHSKQNIVYIYTCPIPNGFRGRVISLHSSKIVDNKQIIRTVSITGIYCSSDKVGTVYLL
jgi:hypothetical protein